MDKFKLIAKTPFQEVFNDDVESIYVVTDDGEIGVFANHASLMTPITFSILSVKKGEKINNFYVRSGLLSFNNDRNECTILAYTIEDKDSIDMSGAKSYLEKINEMLKEGNDLSEYSFKFLENERVGLVKQLEEVDSE